MIYKDIGFTGTQDGLTCSQKEQARAILRVITTLRHGDCIGADEEIHKIARSIKGIYIAGYPPINSNKRAFCDFDVMQEPKEYLVRNKDIVNECTFLLVGPKTLSEEVRSGTWSTYRYAMSIYRPTHILEP